MQGRSYNFESDNEDNINGDELSDLSDCFSDDNDNDDNQQLQAQSSITLDDIPYDRDVKWINVPTNARIKPTMVQSNPFLKQVQSIVSNTNKEDLSKLDNHYIKMDTTKKIYESQFPSKSDDSGRQSTTDEKNGKFRGSRNRSNNTNKSEKPVRVRTDRRERNGTVKEFDDEENDKRDKNREDIPNTRSYHDKGDTRGSRHRNQHVNESNLNNPRLSSRESNQSLMINQRNYYSHSSPPSTQMQSNIVDRGLNNTNNHHKYGYNYDSSTNISAATTLISNLSVSYSAPIKPTNQIAVINHQPSLEDSANKTARLNPNASEFVPGGRTFQTAAPSSSIFVNPH
eukprot:gene6190-8526_t